MDTFLVVIFWLSQAAMAGLGIKVSLKPPEPSKHKYYIWAFVLLALVGGGVNIAQTRRANAATASLQAQLDRIQKNTETPPQVTVEAPKKHARINFLTPADVTARPLLPFHEGEIPSINAVFTNNGDAQALHGLTDGTIVAVPAQEVARNEVFPKHRDRLKPYLTSGTLNPQNSSQHEEIYYHSFYGEKLTAKEVKKLNNQNDVLCFIGLTTWDDETGKFETDFGQCFIKGSGEIFQWSVVPENNQELKR